jgi:hypothetical protein
VRSVTANITQPAYTSHHGRREWSRVLSKRETAMNNNFELGIDELNTVAGGAKGDSGGLDAAKKMDISKFLKELDKALEMLRHN